MCQEKFEVSVKADGLQKILADIQTGKYPFNEDDPPYKIARETLNKVFEGTDEAASFDTACRFEKVLIKAQIGAKRSLAAA